MVEGEFPKRLQLPRILDEAIGRAANVIRHDDRANLVVVLTGAALIGWLLSHHSRPQSF
jgi:hypothetical protein